MENRAYCSPTDGPSQDGVGSKDKRSGLCLRNIKALFYRSIHSGSEEGEYEEPPVGSPTTPRTPITREVEDRFHDIVTISGLAAKLSTYLTTGISWFINFNRLVLFTLLLMPGFFQMILFYFFSPRVLRSITYGAQDRNRLDVYLPRRKFRTAKCPVCIYITGGAWVIGYKAWGALIARRLSQRGVLVFCLDYRNFPQGAALDMLQDINTGIAWCLNNAPLYGGSDDIFLVGQSAGGHLTSLAVMAQAEQTITNNNNNNGMDIHNGPTIGAEPQWDVQALKGFAVVSGTFNLLKLIEHYHKRGLYKRMFNEIMAGPDGQPALEALSPVFTAASLSKKAIQIIPPVLILHGTADVTVPLDNAVEFADMLKEKGVKTTLKLFEGKTHTQPIVEDPMRRGRDVLMDEVLSMILGKECFNTQVGMCPEVLIKAASAVCPF